MKARLTRLTRGMTLAELLVVVSILMLLALLSFLAVQSQIAKGHDARRKSDIYQIKVALEEYEKDHNCYPTSLSCEDVNILQPYIPEIPCDPVTKESYIYFPDENSSVCPNWYWVFTKLENESDALIDDIGCTNGCGYNEESVSYFNYYDSNESAPQPVVGIPDMSGGMETESPDLSGGFPETSSSGYYGCFAGSCQPVGWVDPGVELECSPSYSSNICFNLCLSATGSPQNECM